MTVTTGSPLRPDALEANRRGVLADAQRQAFGRLSWDRRKSELSVAGFLTAGSLLVVFFASSSASHELRVLVPVIGLAIAAFLVARAIKGSDALTRDLRAGEVRSVEGAVGKRHVSGGGATGAYLLDVGDRHFAVTSGTYEAAPAAGYVRAYYLPRSRKLVNLECLPGAPLDHAADLRGVFHTLGAALTARTLTDRNEARAELAGIAGALQAAFAQPQAPPPGARDPRALAQAIAGTWSNDLATVTFSPDGSLTVNVAGQSQRGRWSVDPNGRLHADVPGVPQAADAWVVDDRLTITFDGRGITFERVAG